MEKYRDLSRSRSPLDRKSKPESPNPRFQKLVEKMRTLRKMAPVSENLSLSLLDSVSSPILSEYKNNRNCKTKERVWKNRTTCLESLTTDFSRVITLLDTMERKEIENSQKMKPIKNDKIEPKMELGSATKQKSQEKARYSRYDQERFQVNPVTDLQIDTALSFHGKTFNAIHNLQSSKPILNQLGESFNHSSAIKTVTHSAKMSTTSLPNHQKFRKRVPKTPIIVIPASGTALITMYNVLDILQDLKFITTEEKKQMNCRRENEVLIQRRKEDGTTTPYRVVDNPLKLTDEEWDRVVAVFVQGPAWQFKNWKWCGNPVEMFSKICAFHLKYDDQKLDANVESWSVNILEVSKTKRHMDKAVLPKFWKILDRFIASNKPYLRY
uniref:Parafibromin n=2 Tax=Acrobeloides nanus TaxID=290746 RepID=A0A914EBH2_9BILA